MTRTVATIVFTWLLFADTIGTAFASQKTLATSAGLPCWAANSVAGFNAGILATPLSVTNSILAPLFFAQGWSGLAAVCIAIPGIAEVALVTLVLKALANRKAK